MTSRHDKENPGKSNGGGEGNLTEGQRASPWGYFQHNEDILGDSLFRTNLLCYDKTLLGKGTIRNSI
jgi:hypothetical protein